MFSIFRRGPRFVDREFSDLSLMLTQDEQHPTYRRELLRAEALDFSLESLKHLDEYLEVLHQSPPQGQDFLRVALRCGAYVGEVMRKASPGTYHWVTHEEAAKHSKFIASSQSSIGTAGILWENADALSFPLGKVCKFLENGTEDSVYFFARMLLRKKDDHQSP
ncbi:MAG TPA: hypothetical protein VH814_17770 [Steroidobacteraceae bacterium]